jgi:predicted enzyme related to lactoylglutathione lyase
MRHTALDSLLLSSTNPQRLHAWYVAALPPAEDSQMNGYRILRYGAFHLIIDTRDDVGPRNPEPGRMILNFDVNDARAAVARLDELGAEWLAPLEDRDGSLFATAMDPDGNYVQVIQMSDGHRAAMERQQEEPDVR